MGRIYDGAREMYKTMVTRQLLMETQTELEKVKEECAALRRELEGLKKSLRTPL